MKLISKHVEKNGEGYVKVRPEDDEDMWHLYNLIQEGDKVRAPAIRGVKNVSSTGSVESHRVRTMLTIQVKRTVFSPSSSAGDNGPNTDVTTASLHISGPVVEENQHVKMGAYHTLDIEVHRDLSIMKDNWDSVALERVEESCVPGRGAEVGAIVCGEGTAAFCLLSQHMTVIRQRIEVPIPRKQSSSSAHDKGLEKFYAAVYAGFIRHIPYSNPALRAIVIASPGWVRDAVHDYIMKEATRTGNKAILTARNKFIKVHITSPHVHSLVEVLKSPEIVSQLKETKFAREGMMLDKFFKMLGSDEMRAWYGPDHVALAAEHGAIGTLLISDDLFRSSDPAVRKRYVELVESVKQKNAEVLIFSSMHESGQQLNQLTGIAAILTFPLDVEVVEMEERQAKEEEADRRHEEQSKLE
ncbi:pelota [Punctularia strigosozonata HHB-11173 SS5]|uniref:pelota n=1 Tax=Punctularia strigosozonata (strain HHB-11173) TaxID=741275 RepID=UPI0004416BD5|nr:pelota [Punctularia strigosozonata HHB-11173 SS5]EIN10417.1 pelota [Punctularia strigosozonata HHB-11173 SS5]